MKPNPNEIDARALRAALQAEHAAHSPAVSHLLGRAAAAILPTGPAPLIEEARDA